MYNTYDMYVYMLALPLSKPVYIFVCIGVRIIIVIVLYNYLLSISQFFSLLFFILIFVCEYFISYSPMLKMVASVWVFARGKETLQLCRIQQDTGLLHIESTVVTK